MWRLASSCSFLLFLSTSSVKAKDYRSLTLNEIVQEMYELERLHPNFVTVTTSQEKYSLSKTCDEEENRCYNHMLFIEDPFIYSHQRARRAKKERPDVLISGALHGNERVGPVASLETAKLLATAATCESELASPGVDCISFYEKYSKRQIVWLARLVSTRRIIIVPTANQWGYHYNSRYERSIDPNRDFPFDQTSKESSLCMRTIAARTLNEIFLDHLIQMSVTFHAGMESITYEWGAQSVPNNKLSPDYYAEDTIARGLSNFAGKLSTNTKYQYGDANSIVYAIRGGFEDYAYASSWSDLVNVCNPTTYGGYDKSKTHYDSVSLRTYNFLVETSNSKNPSDGALGSDNNLFTAPFVYDNNTENGYVAKSIRIALMAIDVVEPYIEIVQVRSKKFQSELKPGTQLRNRWSRVKKKIKSKNNQTPTVTWTIGGSFTVDETFLIYGPWSKLPKYFDSIRQLKKVQIEKILSDQTFSKSEIQSGTTKWLQDDNYIGAEQEFSAKLNLKNFSIGTKIAVYVVAKVDQSWQNRPTAVWPDVSPQSHLANGRTNTGYVAKKSSGSYNRIVQGRQLWISIPLTIVITA